MSKKKVFIVSFNGKAFLFSKAQGAAEMIQMLRDSGISGRVIAYGVEI